MSDKDSILENLSEAILKGDEKGAKENTERGIEAGVSPRRMITKGLRPGMERVGKKFETREYFLADLLSSSDAMKEAMDILTPHLGGIEAESDGRVLIGTVQGDLHEIGKSILISLLECHGFEIKDLGNDIPPEKFVEGAKNFDADIVGLSGLLTQSFSSMDETINLMKSEEIPVKVVVGGTCLDEEAASRIGADAYAGDAWEGLILIRELCEEL